MGIIFLKKRREEISVWLWRVCSHSKFERTTGDIRRYTKGLRMRKNGRDTDTDIYLKFSYPNTPKGSLLLGEEKCIHHNRTATWVETGRRRRYFLDLHDCHAWLLCLTLDSLRRKEGVRRDKPTTVEMHNVLENIIESIANVLRSLSCLTFL